MRTFRCERITVVEELEENFSMPLEFNLDDYWTRSEGSFKSNCAEREIYHVNIKVHKSKTEILERLEIINLMEEKDYIIATINMHGYESACDEVMDIIGKAEILEPKELRSFAKNKLKDIVGLYEK